MKKQIMKQINTKKQKMRKINTREKMKKTTHTQKTPKQKEKDRDMKTLFQKNNHFLKNFDMNSKEKIEFTILKKKVIQNVARTDKSKVFKNSVNFFDFFSFSVLKAAKNSKIKTQFFFPSFGWPGLLITSSVACLHWSRSLRQSHAPPRLVTGNPLNDGQPQHCHSKSPLFSCDVCGCVFHMLSGFLSPKHDLEVFVGDFPRRSKFPGAQWSFFG